MESLFLISSRQRAFLVTGAGDDEVIYRANGVAMCDGALVFQDINGEPIIVLAARTWAEVMPK